MATSGTYSFNYNRDQIIRAALRKIGAITAGDIPSAAVTQDAADALNAMIKEWEAMGIHVWTQQEAYLFLQPNQIQYNISPNVVADQTTSTFAQTTIAAGAAQGATSITLTAVKGTTIDDGTATITLAPGYYVGVVLNTG